MLVIRTIYNNAVDDRELQLLEAKIKQCGATTKRKVLRNYWKAENNEEYILEFIVPQDSMPRIKDLYKMKYIQSEIILTQNDINHDIYGPNAIWTHVEFIE